MTWIFSIEGNIGSGKSTAIKHLKEKLHYINGKKIVYLQEPVDIWSSVKDENGNNIIERFYDNPKKFAFQFQMMAYITRITKIRNAINKNPNCIIITERSIYSDRAVFIKMLYDDKTMDKISHNIYNKWFDELAKDIKVTGYIYIKAEPETSLKRIIKRNRPGETITLEYLKKCHNAHNVWLDKEPITLYLNGEKEGETSLPDDWDFAIQSFIQYNTPEDETLTYNILDHPFF